MTVLAFLWTCPKKFYDRSLFEIILFLEIGDWQGMTNFNVLWLNLQTQMSDHSVFQIVFRKIIWNIRPFNIIVKAVLFGFGFIFFQIKICSTSLELTFSTTNSIFSLLTMNWSGVIVSFNFLICLKSLGMFESMTAFPFRASTFHNSFGFW